ncbi:PhoX family protein [Microlunatus parietis]|uniref:Phosphatase n=1 Tax=Microlunatus parietis TaxID=682979 RepID=A0A7Y9IAS3_9ACTN|nr:PhoX family phosphatase [Microlunatus parietis]NYE73392.1 hypothetical protein [Microlunatus parietis]
MARTPGPSRSLATCRHRCGLACARTAPNRSGNTPFGDLVRAEVSRRGLLGGALGALVIGAGAACTAVPSAPRDSAPATPTAASPGPSLAPLAFEPVPPNRDDAVRVPDGYRQRVLIRWGDPVLPGAPEFDHERQTAAAQRQQFGYNNDYLTVVPLPDPERADDHGRRGLLVVNHEYTNEELIFRRYDDKAPTAAQIGVAMAAHGMSVVELERVGDTGEWRLVRSGALPYNRRITVETPLEFTGPAAGSALLRTAADPDGRRVLGTLSNCSGGVTPWGTVLSGEENFDHYFVGGDEAPAAAKPALDRYGFHTKRRHPPGSRHWDTADERFDLAQHPNEANRFGWIVELDPYDSESVPRKRTALGRFKHEGATIVVAGDGRVVAYLGDDERFEYLYKFVSEERLQTGDSADDRRHNRGLLDRGTLYAAEFGFTSAGEIDGAGALPDDGAFNGSGRWLPLAQGELSMIDGMALDEVLVHTRLAADRAGATPLDRPEDVAIHPRDHRVYVSLSNNDYRGAVGRPAADEANPRHDNKHGHVLELIETGGDPAADTFAWSLPIVCGDPDDPATYFAGFDKTSVSPISCPDNLTFDADGNLWISTDGNAVTGPGGDPYNDGLFAVPVDGPERGRVRQFLSVPIGAEQASAYLTPDQRTALVSVQHPGEVGGATADRPASTWPDGDLARPAVVVVWRAGDGLLGR